MSKHPRHTSADGLAQTVLPDVSFPPFEVLGDSLGAFIGFSEIMATAVAALDADGRLLGRNRLFASLLDEGDGLRLAGNSLTAAAQEDADKLASSLAALHRGQGEDLTLPPPVRVLSIRRCGRAALTCAIVPVQLLFAPGAVDASAVAFVSDPEFCLQRSVRSVCALYQLTPTETQLSLYLVRGYNSADIATAMALKEETIRAYLKHIYTKTDTCRQSELVQLLLASSLPLIIPGVQQPVLGVSRRRH